MKTAIKVLEINEKDNFTTAFGKGMVKGVVNSTLIWGTVGLAIILVGKILQGKEVEKIVKSEEA